MTPAGLKWQREARIRKAGRGRKEPSRHGTCLRECTLGKHLFLGQVRLSQASEIPLPPLTKGIWGLRAEVFHLLPVSGLWMDVLQPSWGWTLGRLSWSFSFSVSHCPDLQQRQRPRIFTSALVQASCLDWGVGLETRDSALPRHSLRLAANQTGRCYQLRSEWPWPGPTETLQGTCAQLGLSHS